MTTAQTPSDLPPSRATRGISGSDVDRVADELLRAGIRPTVLKIRERLGTGSPNTINPLLDAWWKRLASRLDAGPHALHRLPEPIAQITETLWLTAVEEGRKRAGQEQKLKTSALDRARRDTDLRRHVLSLREAELEDRLKERSRTMAMMEEQLAALTRLLQQEQANRASAERRITALETELQDNEARTTRLFGRLKTNATTSGERKRAPTKSVQRRKKPAHAAKRSTRRALPRRGPRRSR